MSDESMNHETQADYLAAIAQARVMLRHGIISESDFIHFEEEMRQKYSLPEKSIFRDSILIYVCVQS